LREGQERTKGEERACERRTEREREREKRGRNRERRTISSPLKP